MKSTLILMTTLLSVSAFAGVMNGGGGKGVVCRDSQNQVKSIELLDVWEARTLFNEQLMTVSNDIPAEVDASLHRLMNGYPISMNGINGNKPCEGQQCVLDMMTYVTQKFLQPNANVLRLHGVTLELTDDSYELAKPTGCEIEQIVNYQASGKVYINQDLWDKLDSLNQVALMAHEAFYGMLRMTVGEKNSIRTRRAIGYVMSGNSFQLPTSNFPSKDIIHCVNSNDSDRWTKIDFSWTPDATSPATGNLAVSPVYLQGSRLIGLPNPVMKNIGATETYTSLKEGKCSTNHSGDSAWGFQMDGPVEFDHFFYILYTCNNGIPTLTLQNQQVSESTTTTIPLKCQYIPDSKK